MMLTPPIRPASAFFELLQLSYSSITPLFYGGIISLIIGIVVHIFSTLYSLPFLAKSLGFGLGIYLSRSYDTRSIIPQKISSLYFRHKLLAHSLTIGVELVLTRINPFLGLASGLITGTVSGMLDSWLIPETKEGCEGFFVNVVEL